MVYRGNVLGDRPDCDVSVWDVDPRNRGRQIIDLGSGASSSNRYIYFIPASVISNGQRYICPFNEIEDGSVCCIDIRTGVFGDASDHATTAASGEVEIDASLSDVVQGVISRVNKELAEPGLVCLLGRLLLDEQAAIPYLRSLREGLEFHGTRRGIYENAAS